jgi:hypothetical protein
MPSNIIAKARTNGSAPAFAVESKALSQLVANPCKLKHLDLSRSVSIDGVSILARTDGKGRASRRSGDDVCSRPHLPSTGPSLTPPSPRGSDARTNCKLGAAAGFVRMKF